VHDRGRVAARGLQRQFQRVGDIGFGLHRGAELPGDDVAAVVVEDRAEIEPAPADHLEIGEVGLPKLVRARGLVPELIGCLDHHMSRCRDQVFGLQDAIHR
jgi:hypothetical protein